MYQRVWIRQTKQRSGVMDHILTLRDFLRLREVNWLTQIADIRELTEELRAIHIYYEETQTSFDVTDFFSFEWSTQVSRIPIPLRTSLPIQKLYVDNIESYNRHLTGLCCGRDMQMENCTKLHSMMKSRSYGRSTS